MAIPASTSTSFNPTSAINKDPLAIARSEGQQAGNQINSNKGAPSQPLVDTAWKGYVAECAQSKQTPDPKVFAEKFHGKVSDAQALAAQQTTNPSSSTNGDGKGTALYGQKGWVP